MAALSSCVLRSGGALCRKRGSVGAAMAPNRSSLCVICERCCPSPCIQLFVADLRCASSTVLAGNQGTSGARPPGAGGSSAGGGIGGGVGGGRSATSPGVAGSLLPQPVTPGSSSVSRYSQRGPCPSSAASRCSARCPATAGPPSPCSSSSKASMASSNMRVNAEPCKAESGLGSPASEVSPGVVGSVVSLASARPSRWCCCCGCCCGGCCACWACWGCSGCRCDNRCVSPGRCCACCCCCRSGPWACRCCGYTGPVPS